MPRQTFKKEIQGEMRCASPCEASSSWTRGTSTAAAEKAFWTFFEELFDLEAIHATIPKANARLARVKGDSFSRKAS